MKKFISGLAVGLIIGTIITFAYAKYESGSEDAKSVVGYGSTGSAIVILKTDSNGVVYVQ